MKKPKYRIGEKLKYLSKSPFDSFSRLPDARNFIVINQHELNWPHKHTFRYVGFVPEMGMEQWKEEEDLYSID